MPHRQSLQREVGEHLFDSAILLAHDPLSRFEQSLFNIHATTVHRYRLGGYALEVWKQVDDSAWDFPQIEPQDAVTLVVRQPNTSMCESYRLNTLTEPATLRKDTINKRGAEFLLALVGVHSPHELLPRILEEGHTGAPVIRANRTAAIVTNDYLGDAHLPDVYISAVEEYDAAQQNTPTRIARWQTGNANIRIHMPPEGVPESVQGTTTAEHQPAANRQSLTPTDEELIHTYIQSEEMLDRIYEHVQESSKLARAKSESRV